MPDILRDPVWQFVGALLGLVAISISIVVFFAQRRRKGLSYELISRTSILSVAEEIEGKLQILFQGEPVRKVHLLVIRLVNTGNTPILSSDYERPITIDVSGEGRILTAEVSEVSPENINASVVADEHKITVQPVLLNSGDFLTVKSLVSQFDGKIHVDGRIVGVKRIEKKEESFARVFILTLGGLALTLVGLFLYARFNPRPTTPTPPPTPESWWAIVAVVFGYLISFYGMFSSRRYRRILLVPFRIIADRLRQEN